MSNNKPPSCFGQSWSPTAVECRGGFDPGYKNPKTGTHKREQCLWYSSCATRTNNPMVIPPQRLVRPGQVTTPPPIRPGTTQVRPPAPTTQPAPRQQPVYAHQQPNYQQVPYPDMAPPRVDYPNMAPPHVAYWGPQQVPMVQQQFGAQMPSYLTMPEPINMSVPWWRRLGHEIFRSVMKGGFHTASHFFDHMTFTQPKPPQESK